MQKRWLEPGFLGVLFLTASATWAFFALAGEVVEGETGGFDAAILLALHPIRQPGSPPGPSWLWAFARDITGLGSVGVLTLVVVCACVFLLLANRPGTALFVVVATTLSGGVNTLMKLYFNRPRPLLIDHDLQVYGSSFPSGHAMMSATVYLTLAAVLARTTDKWRLRLYILSVATTLSGLIGISRIYLGVHWPSDVLAGWAAGAAWAIGAWGVAHCMHLGKDAAQ
jgi:undecaprenyl-diphosphatase